MKRKIFMAILAATISFNVGAQTKKELRDSLAVLAREADMHPDSIELRLRKAALNLQLEQWQYAKEEYDNILTLFPNNATALYFRAFAYERMRRYDLAKADYDKILAHIPGNFEALLAVALLNQKMKRHTEALDQANRLVNQHPDKALVYAVRAGIEHERGMLELALYDYEQAIKRDSQNAEYHIYKVETLIDLKRFDEALQELNLLTKMGVARAELAELYKRCKQR
ncbi:tetratricopeptide repeat protein [Prevotella sp. oral taxon 472 str. F0295]|nr:tetratricopeptide repeat protein [Prevotella sp. oral taxon 472]EEX52382.1 tetratricopeptide repeat protein [Prevotella sp. oral taxon 472 str. F0295]